MIKELEKGLWRSKTSFESGAAYVRLQSPVKSARKPIALAMAGFLTLVGAGVFAQSPDGSNTRNLAETTVAQGDYHTDFLDKVYFGDEESEADRVSATDAPVEQAALDVSARSVAPDSGEIAVDLAVDPDEQTMFTVRLWGGDSGASHIRYAIDGESFRRAAGVGSMPAPDDPQQPGRFYYETTTIPESITEGKDTVTVTITAGSDPSQVYAAYTHTENFFAPPPEETQGTPPEPPEPSDPDWDAIRERSFERLDQRVDEAKQEQIYTENFYESGKSAEQYAGLFSRRTGQNFAAAQVMKFLRAYTHEESRHHGDEELIRRSLVAIDGMRRYQGHRGVLMSGRWSKSYLGAPDRTGVGGPLPGFTMSNVATAVLMMQPLLEERPELLGEEIDANADGERSVTRREAWATLFRDYLWENMLLRFGISQKVWNQLTVNAASMMGANEALKFLAPGDAVPDWVMNGQLRHKLGLPVSDRVLDFILELQVRNDGNYGSPSRGSTDPEENGRFYEGRFYHWSASRHYRVLSSKGITQEFGYSPGYGFHNHTSKFLEYTSDPVVKQRVHDFHNGMQHAIHPTHRQIPNADEAFRWSKVAGIGNRNTGGTWSGVGSWDRVLVKEGFDNPVVDRVVREQLRYGDAETLRLEVDNLSALQEWYENEEPTDYRLPAERDEPYAWVDEMTTYAMLHDGETTIYLFDRGSGPAQFQLITDEYRVFGFATSEFSEASHLLWYEIGPYEVAINKSNTKDHRVEGGPRAYQPQTEGGVVDLISGDVVDPSGDLILEPNESLVLDRRRRAEVDEQPRPELVETSIDESRREKRWRWSIPSADAGMARRSLPLDGSEETGRIASYYRKAATYGTDQFTMRVDRFYRPDEVDAGLPVTVEAAGLGVENVDAKTRRLVLDQEPAAGEIEATGILPTFETYDAWRVDRQGFPASSLSTDEHLKVAVESEQQVSGAVPVTFTLPLEGTVTRILFTFRSNWDTTSSLRTVVETDDGRRLWTETKPSDLPEVPGKSTPKKTHEVVNLEGVHVEGALHLRVRNVAPAEEPSESWYSDMTAGAVDAGEPTETTVGKGWYRQIEDVRIEYADGTARYPYR